MVSKFWLPNNETRRDTQFETLVHTLHTVCILARAFVTRRRLKIPRSLAFFALAGKQPEDTMDG